MSPDENGPPTAERPSRDSTTMWWVALGALAAIAVGLTVWNIVAMNRAEDRLEAARDAWRAEARRELEDRTRALLSLSAEPLGLAVRDAAMQENYGTVGTYLDRIARVEGVRGAVLAVGDTVRVAIDETRVGRPISDVVPEGLAAVDESRVEVSGEGTWHVVVPITGLNERIGLLVVTWAPPPPPARADGAAGADTTAGE